MTEPKQHHRSTDYPTSNQQDNRFRFEKTINLGNMISIVLCIGAMMASWNVMDKRVLVLEEARTAQRERDSSQDASAKDSFIVVKEALSDLRRSVEKVADKLGDKK